MTAESSPESDIVEIKREENLAPTHQGPEYDENAVLEDEPSEINGRVEPLPTPKQKLEKKEKNILEAWRKAEIQNRYVKHFCSAISARARLLHGIVMGANSIIVTSAKTKSIVNTLRCTKLVCTV